MKTVKEIIEEKKAQSARKEAELQAERERQKEYERKQLCTAWAQIRESLEGFDLDWSANGDLLVDIGTNRTATISIRFVTENVKYADDCREQGTRLVVVRVSGDLISFRTDPDHFAERLANYL